MSRRFNSGIIVEEPVETTVQGAGQMGETKTTHPSFAQVYVGRVSGHQNLYGSDFTHNGYITLTIQGSELRRSLSRDWHFASKPIIEIALSEAQWASLVSSFNIGSGVPCTLQYTREDGLIPRLPAPKSRVDQFAGEMKEDFEEALASLDELLKAIDEGTTGMSKKKADTVREYVTTARAKLTGSAPFVAEQFGEHMENEMGRARTEIHGYATSLFVRAGIERIANMEPPIALPGGAAPALEDRHVED